MNNNNDSTTCRDSRHIVFVGPDLCAGAVARVTANAPMGSPLRAELERCRRLRVNRFWVHQLTGPNDRKGWLIEYNRRCRGTAAAVYAADGRCGVGLTPYGFTGLCAPVVAAWAGVARDDLIVVIGPVAHPERHVVLRHYSQLERDWMAFRRSGFVRLFFVQERGTRDHYMVGYRRTGRGAAGWDRFTFYDGDGEVAFCDGHPVTIERTIRAWLTRPRNAWERIAGDLAI